MDNREVIEKLKKGNEQYPECRYNPGDVSSELEIVGAVYNVDTGKVDWI